MCGTYTSDAINPSYDDVTHVTRKLQPLHQVVVGDHRTLATSLYPEAFNTIYGVWCEHCSWWFSIFLGRPMRKSATFDMKLIFF